MITDELVKKVEKQPFDEDMFCDAACFIFQDENGVNRFNEPKDCTDEQVDWARLYIDKWDCEVECWNYAGLEEGMWQDLQETKRREAKS
jgi:hypothetical protein